MSDKTADMSDTPRVDALMDDADAFVLHGPAVIINLARTLERELAARRAELDGTKWQIGQLKEDADYKLFRAYEKIKQLESRLGSRDSSGLVPSPESYPPTFSDNLARSHVPAPAPDSQAEELAALANRYEKQGYIDIAFDMDKDELETVIAALRSRQAPRGEDVAIGALADIAYSKDMTLEIARKKAARVYQELAAHPQSGEDDKGE